MPHRVRDVAQDDDVGPLGTLAAEGEARREPAEAHVAAQRAAHVERAAAGAFARGEPGAQALREAPHGDLHALHVGARERGEARGREALPAPRLRARALLERGVAARRLLERVERRAEPPRDEVERARREPAPAERLLHRGEVARGGAPASRAEEAPPIEPDLGRGDEGAPVEPGRGALEEARHGAALAGERRAREGRQAVEQLVQRQGRVAQLVALEQAGRVELGEEPALHPVEEAPQPGEVDREELLEQRDVRAALHERRAQRGAEALALAGPDEGERTAGVRHLDRRHAHAALAQEPCELDEARLHEARL